MREAGGARRNKKIGLAPPLATEPVCLSLSILSHSLFSNEENTHTKKKDSSEKAIPRKFPLNILLRNRRSLPPRSASHQVGVNIEGGGEAILAPRLTLL